LIQTTTLSIGELLVLHAFFEPRSLRMKELK
jgi:hypothetical protein